jgi:predicted TIM-barrel fold metal-dependent hydrolase
MKRRDFIRTTVGTGAVLAAVGANGVELKPTRVIDTHTHFYDPTRPQGVPWPGKNTKLYRTVLPEDWAAVAAPQGVKETIVVEASEWVEDNQWVLDLAAKDARLIGVVGNLDPNDAAFEKNVKRFAANPKFRGVRWRGGLVDIDKNPDNVLKGAKVLAEHGLELDLNGSVAMLPHVLKLAEAVPDLKIVVNHLGGSGDPANLKAGWDKSVAILARQCPNVFMKVSALVEQVPGAEGAAPREVAYYLPVLDHLWTEFGEDRLIYGSNWPVSDRGAPYEVVFALVREFFAGKGEVAMGKYFWKNALVAYGVK